MLLSMFHGVSQGLSYLPGIQTFPTGDWAKGLIHRMGDELAYTPRMAGHPQGHRRGALTVPPLPHLNPPRVMGPAEIVICRPQGDPPAQGTYTVGQRPGSAWHATLSTSA
jgi:hypothetical protein